MIIVRDGRIAGAGPQGLDQIPPSATVLDCTGCTIAAGFRNSHVHFHERMWADAGEIPASELGAQLQELTRYGFTHVFDLSSRHENTRRICDRIESGEVPGPHIRTTGEGLIPAGGAPSPDVFRALGLTPTALAEVSDSAQARRAARELLADGVDALKLFISAPSGGRLADDAIRAATDEAHRAGKLVFAHPNTDDDVRASLDGGVDVIAHTTPRSGSWDDELVARMKASGAALIPTLMVWTSMMRHDRRSIREHAVATAVGQLRAWLECGGPVLFGTDLGAVEYDPTDEYRLMKASGATFAQILASLTTAPAQRFENAAARGEIRTGNTADLVVFEGDPSLDIAALAAVRYTLRAGEIIYRA